MDTMPYFPPRNTRLVPVEEANAVYICQAPWAGPELRDALVVCSDERAPYNLIIVIICVECGAEECGANFHAVHSYCRPSRRSHASTYNSPAYIVPGTTIISDLWVAYNTLGTLGYQHLTVNHTSNFVDCQRSWKCG